MDNATFSEFLRDPNGVIDKLHDSRSVVLERRDAPALVLSLKSRQEEASFGEEMVAHFLARVLGNVPAQARSELKDVFRAALVEKLPWARLLPTHERETFVREFLETAEACASVGNNAPLAQLVHEWKATADIYADPALAADLKRPLPAGNGKRRPSTSDCLRHCAFGWPKSMQTDHVDGVHLRKRILLTARFEKPALNPRCDSDIRAVLASCAGFDPDRPCGVYAFLELFFQQPLFLGRGEFLLRWLEVRPTTSDYHALLARLYPHAVANLILGEQCEGDRWCAEDRGHFERSLLSARTGPSVGPEEPFASSFRALTGAIALSVADPDLSYLRLRVASWPQAAPTSEPPL